MFQSELFIPAALEYKEKGLRQLEEFDFKAAAECFMIAKEIDPYLADLDFLILLSEWQDAHQTLLNLVTDAREQALALHWGYLGDAAHVLRRWKDANMAYVCALFSDPDGIDLHMLQQAELREVLETLKRETQDENLAHALWPVHAWMQGVVRIPRGNTFLLPLVQKQRSIIGSELMLEPVQRVRQFSLCLYIDQSGLHGEIQFDARAEMQNLDPEIFSRYLQEIERRAPSKLG